jgi:hypothetical protein
MKTRIGLLIASAAIASATFFTPTPASANTNDVCVGTGVAVLSNGLGVPALHPVNHANFTFQLGGGVGVGVCLTKTQLNAHGTVWGHCGLSNGVGTTTNGHDFTFTGVGTVLVLTGEVVGTVEALEDPLDNGSCLSKSATRFLVTGEAVLIED